MRKKLLSLAMLPLLILSVLSALSVNIGEVSAASAEDAVIKVLPEGTINLSPDAEGIISIYTDYDETADVWGYEFTLTYNPVVLNVLNVTNGPVVANKTGITSARFQNGTIDNEAGKLEVTSAYFFFVDPPANVTSGPGILANVGFKVMGTGDSDIILGPETKLIGMNASTGEEYNIIDDTMKGHTLNGYFANIDPNHDVAITSVTANDTDVRSGELVNVTVVAANQGDVIEKFDVTAYYNNIPIGTETITLGVSDTQTLNFTWDTAPARGNVTILTEASTVGSTIDPETDTLDNNMTYSTPVTVNPTILAVDPDEIINTTMLGGSSFNVNITITDAYDLYMTVFNLTWDPAILTVTSIVNGSFLEGAGTTVFNIVASDTNYKIVNYSRTGGAPGKTGDGVLAMVTFEVVSKGGSNIELKPYPVWWTTYWSSTPVIANGLFTNNYEVEAWKLFIDGIDWEIDVYPTWTQPFIIGVNPRNNGFLYATFNISVYENDTLIEKFAQSLEGKQGIKPQIQRRFSVHWNITDHELGFYILKYNITDILPGDLNSGNNELADTWGVKVKLEGDIDGDADVDPDDFFIFSGKYGTRKGDAQYSLQADMDGDGDVDPDDFYIFSGKYGSSTDKYV